MKTMKRTVAKGDAKEVKKPKHRMKDLISLVWPINTCYSTLIAGVPKGVTVDLMEGTWTFQGHTYPIGSQRRYCCSEGVGYPINVYDRTNMKHLDEFKTDAEWVKDRLRPCFGDD